VGPTPSSLITLIKHSPLITLIKQSPLITLIKHSPLITLIKHSPLISLSLKHSPLISLSLKLFSSTTRFNSALLEPLIAAHSRSPDSSVFFNTVSFSSRVSLLAEDATEQDVEQTLWGT
jgi:hypothetical protein